jgi:putative FmdB family regulatory protein
MPIYEYRCGNCQRRVSIFVKGFNDPQSLECPQCGSLDLSRLFSKFSIGKGEWYQRKGIYEDILSDHQLVRGLESNDPRALAEWNRRMSRGADEEIIPEYEEMTEKLEAGEPLENVMGEAEAAMDSVGG